MEPCIPAARTLVSRTRGLEAKEIFSPSGRGRKMPLTSPLIDQALSQLCAFHSPFSMSMSDTEIHPLTPAEGSAAANCFLLHRIRISCDPSLRPIRLYPMQLQVPGDCRYAAYSVRFSSWSERSI